MKRIPAVMFGVTLMAGMSLVSSAQSQSKPTGSYDSKTTNTTVTDTAKTTTTSETRYGRVEEYMPGKSLKISTPGKSEGTKSYALDSKDQTYKMASDLKVGDWVSVTEKKDNNGRMVMTVSHSKHAGRSQ